jgi:chromosome segregation ATPase
MKVVNRISGLVLLCAAGVSSAQQSRDDGNTARFQAMVQQLTTEKTQLQTQNADLKKQLDAANADLKKLRDEKSGLERRLTASEGSLNQATAANTRNTQLAERQKASQDELVAQFRMTIETLRQTELERNELKTALAARGSTLKTCVANNQKLFDTGVEVLDRYEQKGCFTSIRENEPFTQNKRVQLQNLVDEYRWKLEDDLLPASAKSAADASDGSAAAPADGGGPAASAADAAAPR